MKERINGREGDGVKTWNQRFRSVQGGLEKGSKLKSGDIRWILREVEVGGM